MEFDKLSDQNQRMFNPSIVICLNALGFPFSTDKSMVCSVFGPLPILLTYQEHFGLFFYLQNRQLGFLFSAVLELPI